MPDHATTRLTQAQMLQHFADHADDEEHAAALRLHLETDHNAVLFEDDSLTDAYVMHEGMHRQRITPPAPPVQEQPAELVLARQQHELARAQAQEQSYDAAVPNTLRERMTYARALAASGLIPRAFRSQRPGEDGLRETTANVLLATELGRELGLSPLQSLTSINVVEGRPGLGAEAQLARILEAGHEAWVDEASDGTQATVHGIRYRDGQPGRQQSFTFTLEDAQRAGLCRIVDGRAHARSKSGNPLPWETSTPDMLIWRATTRMGKRMFPDVVRGLAVSDGGEGEHYGPQRTTVEQVPERARPVQQPADDTVEADLALFPDGLWWEHSGAQVRRRTKLQLAADRLMAAHLDGDERVPAPYARDDEPVDAEVVEDGQQSGLTDVMAAEPTAERVVDVPVDDVAHDDPADDDGSVDDGYQQAVLVGETAAADDRREVLWQEVATLAEQRGKTVTQLLARHSLALRKELPQMDADDLAAFLDAQPR